MRVLISPNMSLPIPGVGTETGPDFALDVNSCLTLLDAHDHSPGSGIQITPAGLNINTSLTFNSNQATNLLSASFTAQSAASVVLQSISVAPGTESPSPIQDLWYTDSSGKAIQITSNGAVNATIGSLPGESYSAGTFFWKQGSGSTIPANFDIGSIVIRPNVAATSYGVTLQPPAAIASAYTLTLPPDPATATGSNFLIMSTAGVITGGALVDNSSIQYTSNQLSVKAGGITTAMLAPGIAVTGQIQDILTIGASSLVIPSGVTSIIAFTLGGGGGGGSGDRSGAGGTGGAGAMPVMNIIPVTPGETLSVIVGAGGAGGGASGGGGNPGTAGGNTSITRGSSRLILSVGGPGGGVGGASNPATVTIFGSNSAGGTAATDGGNTPFSAAHGTAGTSAFAGGGGGAGFGDTPIAASGGASGLGVPAGGGTGGGGRGAGGGGGQGGTAAGGNFGGPGGQGNAGMVRVFFVGP